ncbi:hypothetical protein BGY98DRAFT_1179395 [Russula aff. rugulosa BPL654]|nr:hypothetical protein BGY98DRAFT_1179395 [Russula aff. rugulosa BPL654]
MKHFHYPNCFIFIRLYPCTVSQIFELCDDAMCTTSCSNKLPITKVSYPKGQKSQLYCTLRRNKLESGQTAKEALSRRETVLVGLGYWLPIIGSLEYGAAGSMVFASYQVDPARDLAHCSMVVPPSPFKNVNPACGVSVHKWDGSLFRQHYSPTGPKTRQEMVYFSRVPI